MSRALTDIHIAPGPSAGGCLQAGLGLPGDQLLISHDVLSCGPLPPLDSPDDWRDVRQAYLRSIDREWPTFAFADQDRDLFTNRDRLRAAGNITLWIGTGLAEQLLLVWVLGLLRRLGVDPAKLQIVQFDRDRKYEIVSVGVLNPAQFKDHPHPTKVDDAALQEAADAWTAVTNPEPEKLLDILNSRERSLPFLRRSLLALLYRYPDLRTGLNAWEYEMLRYVREDGPRAIRVVGSTIAHDLDVPDWVGDGYLFERLHRLADSALPRPLVKLTGETEKLGGTLVHLTPDCEDVMAGNANAVEWNGVDDWIGGVHLDSRQGRVWFRKDHTLIRSKG